MIQQIPTDSPNMLAFKLSGTLHDEDYKHFDPVVQAAVAHHGKVRVLAQLEDFHGWDPQALWDDIKFASAHYADIERIAIVGDRKWEEWMAAFCKPFTQASVKYFDTADLDFAWKWLREGTWERSAA